MVWVAIFQPVGPRISTWIGWAFEGMLETWTATLSPALPVKVLRLFCPARVLMLLMTPAVSAVVTSLEMVTVAEVTVWVASGTMAIVYVPVSGRVGRSIVRFAARDCMPTRATLSGRKTYTLAAVL